MRNWRWKGSECAARAHVELSAGDSQFLAARSGMTGQLLAFSRRQAVQPKVLDLCVLLRNIERLLQRMIGEHVDLSVHCGPEPCLIHADAHQMEQVLMNLAVMRETRCRSAGLSKSSAKGCRNRWSGPGKSR